ncbi:MAG: Lsr2 [Frankiales bacterium]|nr:Lsr2 [Frankiales bacterium]
MKTTPPKSSDVRQWARQKGLEVGERGRLSPEVLAAYSAAHGGAKVAPAAKKPAAKKAAAKRPAAKKAAAKKSPATRSVTTAAAAAPSTAPAVAVDSALVASLNDKLAALAARVERLESARAAAPAKRGLFGRKS